MNIQTESISEKRSTDTRRKGVGLFRLGLATLISLALILGSLPVLSVAAPLLPSAVSEEISVHAAAKKITVKFNANGGESTRKSIKATVGKKYGALPTATRSGYTFLGWYTKKSGGTKKTAASKVSSGYKTLYAHWKQKVVNHFTLKFDANGGTVSIASKKISYNKPIGALPTPSRPGYSFDSWYESNGTRVTETSLLTARRSFTVYARWIPNTYTVTFDPGTGKVSPDTMRVTQGEAYGTLPVPTKAMYDFVGWFTDSANGTRVTAATIVDLTTNQTLYARYTLMQSIWLHEMEEFTYSGGGFSDPTTFTDNESVVHYNGVQTSWNRENSETYLLNGSFGKFSGAITLSYSDRSSTYKRIYQFYADGRLIYTSPEVTQGVRPFTFNINVAGVTQLKIATTSTGSFTTGIVDAKFEQ